MSNTIEQLTRCTDSYPVGRRHDADDQNAQEPGGAEGAAPHHDPVGGSPVDAVRLGLWGDMATPASPDSAAAPAPAPAPPPPTVSERDVLVELYNATNGPNWDNNAGWNSSEPLDAWHGVFADADGSVTGLTLADNELRGSIPESLGGLMKLTELFLHRNELSGPIPASLGQPHSARAVASQQQRPGRFDPGVAG